MILEELIDAARARVQSKRGDEWTINCPFCPDNGHSEDTGFHLGVNVSKGWAHCFRCDWRCSNLRATVKQLAEKWGLKYDERELRSRMADALIGEPSKVLPKHIQLPDEYEQFTGTGDPVERKALKYLQSRKISRTQIIRHRIGYASSGRLAWRILFPVIGPDDLIYGVVGRDFSGQNDPKYLNTAGIKLLWNAQTPAHIAVVTEGILDALRVEHAIRNWPGWSVVARLGSTATELQLEQLSRFNHVVVFPDFDRAGVDGALKLIPMIRETSKSDVSVVIPDQMNEADPGSMSVKQLRMLLREARAWSPGAKIRLKAAKGNRA